MSDKQEPCQVPRETQRTDDCNVDGQGNGVGELLGNANESGRNQLTQYRTSSSK